MEESSNHDDFNKEMEFAKAWQHVELTVPMENAREVKKAFIWRFALFCFAALIGLFGLFVNAHLYPSPIHYLIVTWIIAAVWVSHQKAGDILGFTPFWHKSIPYVFVFVFAYFVVFISVRSTLYSIGISALIAIYFGLLSIGAFKGLKDIRKASVARQMAAYLATLPANKRGEVFGILWKVDDKQ